MQGVLSPEPAKSLGEVMGHIERWEEKVGRLDEGNELTNNMKAALIGKLCPKKLRDHLELHLAGKKEYHVMKQQIIRMLDTGLLGRADNREDKPHNSMEIDPLLNGVDPAYERVCMQMLMR